MKLTLIALSTAALADSQAVTEYVVPRERRDLPSQGSLYNWFSRFSAASRAASAQSELFRSATSTMVLLELEYLVEAGVYLTDFNSYALTRTRGIDFQYTDIGSDYKSLAVGPVTRFIDQQNSLISEAKYKLYNQISGIDSTLTATTYLYDNGETVSYSESTNAIQLYGSHIRDIAGDAARIGPAIGVQVNDPVAAQQMLTSWPELMTSWNEVISLFSLETSDESPFNPSPVVCVGTTLFAGLGKDAENASPLSTSAAASTAASASSNQPSVTGSNAITSASASAAGNASRTSAIVGTTSKNAAGISLVGAMAATMAGAVALLL